MNYQAIATFAIYEIFIIIGILIIIKAFMYKEIRRSPTDALNPITDLKLMWTKRFRKKKDKDAQIKRLDTLG